MTTRRQHLAQLLSAVAGAAGLRWYGRARAEANPLTTFISPYIEPYVDELPRLPPRPVPGRLAASASRHRFHRDLPLERLWAYGNQSYLGPTLEAHRDQPVRISFANELGAHPLARHMDLSMMGTSMLDRERPRTVVHLHGGLTEPNSDGHPLSTVRPGGVREHHYGNGQQAAGLWYHDHALGITRLNVFAGLAGHYLVRDDFDTGREGNPVGLPTGEFEIPLVLQDRIFMPDGFVTFRTSTYVEEGKWEGGQAGDTALVNGKVTPKLTVARGLYRFRLLNGSNLRAYMLTFPSKKPFYVIGGDLGLFDAPVQTTELRIGPGERYDVLIDFRDHDPGEKLELINTQRLPAQFQLFGDPVVTKIMQFVVSATPGFRAAVPTRLRGAGLDHVMPPLQTPTRTRNMTVLQNPDFSRFPPAMMSLNNLMYDSEDVDFVQAGRFELWNFINFTIDEHPLHVHLARLRVLGRQRFDGSALQLLQPRPDMGTRWTPSADDYAQGEPLAPEPWEQGYKDTVIAPPGEITRVLVEWPSAEEMKFDPDAPVQVANRVALGAPSSDGKRALRLHPVVQDSPTTVRGYQWHCHVLDHEDHDMMLPLRVQTS
jgi:spore coat protein A